MLEKLKKLGLTLGESKVYVSLLKLGQSKVGAIVKESGVSYSKVYDVLERLMKKGFVSFVLVENIKHFRAAEPHQINEYLKRKENEIKKEKKLAEIIIPKLMKITKVEEQTNVEVFIGKKGLKTAYEILMSSGKKEDVLKYFQPFDEHYSIAEEFYTNSFLKKSRYLTERGISTLKFKEQKGLKKLPNHLKIKYVDFPLPGTIDILGNKVLIVTWSGEITGILINSKEIGDYYTNYFDSLWKIAKE